MKLKRILLSLTIVSLSLGFSSFQQENESLVWLKIEQVDEYIIKENRPVLIDLYTSWCGWCKHMDKNTFSDPVVSAYLKENFYVVKFNAERTTPVNFRGKSYGRVPDTKYNELAVAMLNGKMAFPTIVYLDATGAYHSTDPGYKTPEQLLVKLKEIVAESK